MFYYFLTGYLAVSDDRKNLMIGTLGLSSEKVSMIHWGIDSDSISHNTEQGDMRTKLGLPDCRIIFSLGHLGSIKGHDDSIKALSIVKRKFRDAKLYIAGDGSEADHERLHLLIEELKVQNSVILLGQITNALEWMQACDLFLQPSLEEAFGLVFLEAGLCKKPTIATTVGGIPEIIDDGVTGYLVSPQKPDALAEKIITLLSSEERMQQMGDAAHAKVKQHFVLSKQIDKLEQHFNSLVQNR